MSLKQPNVHQEIMSDRLFRWIGCNVVLSLFPVFASIGIRMMAGKTSAEVLRGNPDLLFFVVALSATSLNELTAPMMRQRWSALSTVVFITLIIGMATGSILCGGLVVDTQVTRLPPSFRDTMAPVTLFLLVLYGLVAFGIQCYVGWSEAEQAVALKQGSKQ